MIPFSVLVCLSGIEDCIASSVEGEEPQTQQAELDPGTFEMHHRGLEAFFFLFILVCSTHGSADHPATFSVDLQR